MSESVTNPTREENIHRFYNSSVGVRLRELLEIMEPSQRLTWGGYSHNNLVAYAATKLLDEYHALTGERLVDSIYSAIKNSGADEHVQPAAEAEALRLD